MSVHIKVPVFPQAPVSPDPLAVYNCLNDVINYLVPLAQNFNVPGQPSNFQATANTFGVLLTWHSPKGTNTSAYRIHRHTAPNYAQSTVLAIVSADKDPTIGKYQYIDSADPTAIPLYYWIVGENDVGATGPVSPMQTVSNMSFSTVSTGTTIGIGAVGGDKNVTIGDGADTSGATGSIAIGYQATSSVNGEAVFGSTAAPLNLFGIVAGLNGERWQIVSQTQILTIAAAPTTVSATFFNAGDIVFGVTARVTTTIPTAANFTMILSTDGTLLNLAAPGVNTAAGTTDVGTANCPHEVTTAQGVTIQPNINPATNAGRVRLCAYSLRLTPATS